MGQRILFVSSDIGSTNRRLHQQREVWEERGWLAKEFSAPEILETQKSKSHRFAFRVRILRISRKLEKLVNLDPDWIKTVIEANREILLRKSWSKRLLPGRLQDFWIFFVTIIFELKFIRRYRPAFSTSLMRLPDDPSALILRKISKEFTKVVSQFKPDVIWLENYYSWSVVKCLAKEQRSFLIYDAPEFAQGAPGLQPLVRVRIEKLEREALNNVHFFTCTSENILEVFRQTYNNTLPQARIINNAYSYKQYKVSSAKSGESKLPIITSEAKRRLIYHGALIEDRNLELLIEIFASDGLTWELYIMGDGPLRERLQSMAGTRVHFLPYVHPKMVNDVLSQMDACIVPYRANCLNHMYSVANKFFDAANAGLPVIVNQNLLVLESWIEKYHLGAVLPLEIQNSLVNFLHNDFQHLGKPNFTGFMNDHGWDRQEQTILDIIEEIIVRKRPIGLN